MAEIVQFHHVQGLTPGLIAFADRFRSAGHTVHTPDLFDGRTFGSIQEGLDFVRTIGFEETMELGVTAVEGLPAELVYVGLSLGVMSAQKLAQTRSGALGAVFLYSCLPTSEFGVWPAGIPVQIHGMDADPFFVDEGDLDAARELVEEAEDGALFLYSGDQHYFTDSSLPAYDEAATTLVVRRMLEFLDKI